MKKALFLLIACLLTMLINWVWFEYHWTYGKVAMRRMS